MNIQDVVNVIRRLPECNLLPPNGFPEIKEPHILPHDLRAFYEICGGAILFEKSAFPTEITAQNKFILANPVIFAHVSEEHLITIKDDISWSWYIIGYGLNSQYITIDLAPERLGFCYDSKWDRHPRASYIIAKSFTDLLKGLLTTKGQYDYWDDLGFELGSPYDLPSSQPEL